MTGEIGDSANTSAHADAKCAEDCGGSYEGRSGVCDRYTREWRKGGKEDDSQWMILSSTNTK